MSIVRELFERLGLCAEYVRTRVISNNYEIMLLADELAWNVNNRRTREWEMSINQLEKKLCMGLMQNRQFLMVAKNALELHTEKITMQEYIQKMLKSLEATISPTKAITPGEKFLTREEIDHIFNIGTRMGTEVNNPYMQVIREICEKYQKEGELEIHISKYEFLGTGLCSYLGNIGEFDTSDDYSNILIKESLRQRRMSSLAKNIYNNYWNNKQRELKNVPIRDVYNGEKELERCILFAKLNKRENDVKFYEKKLREM